MRQADKRLRAEEELVRIGEEEEALNRNLRDSITALSDAIDQTGAVHGTRPAECGRDACGSLMMVERPSLWSSRHRDGPGQDRAEHRRVLPAARLAREPHVRAVAPAASLAPRA